MVWPMKTPELSRREMVKAAAGAAVLRPEKKMSTKAPVLFVAHGAPPLLEDAQWMSQLSSWGQQLGKPKAILMLSAHWEEKPFSIGATKPLPLIYDFYGFPPEYYRLQYPAAGAPDVAARLRSLVKGAVDEPTRGLDHGVYMPLLAMYPKADVPVLQASLPSLDPKGLFELGKTLAPLRDEGVMIAGSGFITHNLRTMGRGPAPQWAVEFDQWTAEAVLERDVDSLIQFMTRGPGAKMALPTVEHFVPLLVTMGVVANDSSEATFPIDGFWFSSFTKRSVQFG